MSSIVFIKPLLVRPGAVIQMTGKVLFTCWNVPELHSPVMVTAGHM